jgi:uncharacterized surface protein with fasciclin (FAS1) repeats
LTHAGPRHHAAAPTLEEIRSMNRISRLAAVATIVAGLAAPATLRAADQKDIVDTAVAAGQFTTLAKALDAAGLISTLKGKGPFTVFAPTDDAFAKLPAGTLEALLKDKAKLTKVLTYHVVPGKVLAADVVKLKEAKTVEGSSIKIDTSSGVKVDNANVVKTDIIASNGVIHVIDAVILPAN